RAQRIGGRGAQPPSRGPARQVTGPSERAPEAPVGVPPAPPAARAVFGAALPVAERYVARLATDGVTRGLIGPREVPRLWERHVLNSAAVAEALPRGAPGVQVGRGHGRKP